MMRIRNVLVAACAMLPVAATLAAETPAEANTIDWQTTTRDVYVDGQIRVDATVLRASEPDRLAVVLPQADRVWLATEQDDSLTLATLPADAFEFSEPQRATTSAEPESADGMVTEAGDILWLSIGDRQLLVAPHAGPSGAIEAEDLWRTVPLWRQLRDVYEPDDASVAALRDEPRQLLMLVAFGTWCGDSRRSVPRLLKALDEAKNLDLGVELLAIDRSFTEPLDRVRQLQITNVPTIIVYQGDREIGRVIERPHGEVVEQDIAAILVGKPLAPSELFRDEDQLIAEGRLERQGGRASEDWRLYSTAEDEHRLFVQRHDDDGTTEIWQRFDSDGATAFLEVTRTADGQRSRTRWSRVGQRLRSTTRGDVTGIVRQEIDLPPSSIVLAPSLVATGLACRWLGDDAAVASAYLAAGVGTPAPGRVQPVELKRLAEEKDGEQMRCDVETANGRMALLLDPATGAPWQVEAGGDSWRQIEPVEQAR